MTTTTRLRLRYALSDYLLLNLGWCIFNLVRYRSLPVDWPGTASFMLSGTVLLGQLLVPLLGVGLYVVSGYYNLPRNKSRVDNVLNTAAVSAVAALCIYFAVLVNDDIPERLLNYQLLAILWLLLAVPVYTGRHIITARDKRRLLAGGDIPAAIVVGCGERAREVARRTQRRTAGNAFRVVAFAGSGEGCIDLDRAEAMVRAGEVRDIIVADDTASIPALLGRFVPLGCNLYMPADSANVLTHRPRVLSVVNEPLINISAPGMSPATSNLKRLGDAVVSAVAMTALLPVYAAIAIAVKLDSRGPVLYRQERVGLHGRPFRIVKFRSMRPDAEASGPSLSSDGDPRITRVGAFLRKYRLDELPQFWNVLMGQMSIVGPRPERPHFERLIAERAPQMALLHTVRPGITSWGMVKYGYARNVDEMVERLHYDILYVENASLGLDMRILLHTINTVITGKGI
ncbi:MAG: sugar transferase [Muribaculaceae bacterium]|nr:sugar transferase [Muribaculaceae bacterium]